MKKITNILVVLVLMVSIASFAMADEEPGQDPLGEGQSGSGENGQNNTSNGNNTVDPDSNETEDPDGNESEEPEGNETEEPEDNETDDGLDNETEEEIGIMNNSLGAEIRLLQLEKAILKNIIKGERAVDVLKGISSFDYNTSDLEEILDKLGVLLEEVQAADPESNESVRIFVELKYEARNLTKQFRESIKELIGDAKVKELRERIREMVGDELENCSKKIRNKIKQFNRNQLHRLYGIIGESNYSLYEEYENGNISMEQVKSQINKMLNRMNKEKKSEIFSEVKEVNIKEKINGKAFAEDMKNKGKGKGHGKGK